MVRFGVQVRADGVTANSRTTNRMIGYLCKYLTKTLDTCHTTTSDTQRAHTDRLADALRYEPCSPTCSNWLLFAVQPKNARPGLSPGRCTGKAHRRETLGFGGRRVLVSRQWSGKSLADHRNDRKTWVRTLLTALGTGTSPDEEREKERRLIWQLARPGEPGVPRREHLILHAIAQRHRWRSELDAARVASAGRHPPGDPLSATIPTTCAA